MMPHFVIKLGFLLGLTAAIAGPAQATTSWIGGDGDWFASENWSAGLPDFETDAEINNGATATIGSGGSAVTEFINLGVGANDSGTLIISHGSSLTTDFVFAGDFGTGTLRITEGSVTDLGSVLGFGAGSHGIAMVDGAASSWTHLDGLTIGFFGAGRLDVTNGARVLSPISILGWHPGSVGVARVDGTGSAWDNATQLVVGLIGSGTLEITNGGAVSNFVGRVGSTTVGNGFVTVDGLGSTWTNGDQLTIGGFGTGTLTITNGGTVSNAFGAVGQGFEGRDFPATGLVIVDGAGSTWTNRTGVNIGGSGTGTLKITNAGAVSSPVGTIAGGTGSTGIVTVDGAGSSWRNSGDLRVGRQGTGTLEITDGGSVLSKSGLIGGTFLGLNAHASGLVMVDGTGSSWINSGQLVVGNGGAGTLKITNGGAVSDTDAYVGFFGRAVGAITVDGVGSTWTNSGQLIVAYRNSTGMLDILNGGTVWSRDGFIGYGIFGNDSGPSGSATVRVDGAGSTWNNSNNLYIGGSSEGPVFPGVLRIENGGAVNASLMQIWQTGILEIGGLGKINGNVTNAGIVRSTGSPGTLAVNGNYAQASTGTLQIGIAGRVPAAHDLLAIGGSASLGGTLQLLRLDNFTLRVGDKIIFLTANGGVNGVFTTVDNPFASLGPLLEPMVVYEPNDVALVFLQKSFVISGLTPNQQSVAKNLDRAAGDSRAGNLINFLDTERLDSLPHDYDLIAPEELTAIYETGFSQARIQSNNLEHRLSDIRAGSTGFSSFGYIISGEKRTQTPDRDVLEAKETPRSSIMEARPDNRWGVFVTGTGQLVDVGSDFNAAGYDITTGGMTFGLDYRVSGNFAVGFYGGYAHSKVDLVNDGRIDTNSGKLGGYATFHRGAFHVDGIVGGGLNGYDTRRTALAGMARGETDGAEFQGEIATGYDWTFAGITFGPKAALRYVSVRFDGFSESGSLAPLQVEGDDEQNLNSALGLKLTRDCTIGRATVRPEIGAAWKHEFGDNRGNAINGRLASGAGGLFATRGPSLGRESALLNAGLSIEWTERCATYIFYDGELGRRRFDSHALSSGVRISF